MEPTAREGGFPPGWLAVPWTLTPLSLLGASAPHRAAEMSALVELVMRGTEQVGPISGGDQRTDTLGMDECSRDKEEKGKGKAPRLVFVICPPRVGTRVSGTVHTGSRVHQAVSDADGVRGLQQGLSWY